MWKPDSVTFMITEHPALLICTQENIIHLILKFYIIVWNCSKEFHSESFWWSLSGKLLTLLPLIQLVVCLHMLFNGHYLYLMALAIAGSYQSQCSCFHIWHVITHIIYMSCFFYSIDFISKGTTIKIIHDLASYILGADGSAEFCGLDM